jgi:hypothetical protein
VPPASLCGISAWHSSAAASASGRSQPGTATVLRAGAGCTLCVRRLRYAGHAALQKTSATERLSQCLQLAATKLLKSRETRHCYISGVSGLGLIQVVNCLRAFSKARVSSDTSGTSVAGRVLSRAHGVRPLLCTTISCLSVRRGRSMGRRLYARPRIAVVRHDLEGGPMFFSHSSHATTPKRSMAKRSEIV